MTAKTQNLDVPDRKQCQALIDGPPTWTLAEVLRLRLATVQVQVREMHMAVRTLDERMNMIEGELLQLARLLEKEEAPCES